MTAKENADPTQEYIGYAKDIGFVATAQVVVSLLQFIRIPILTKWLGASLYGTWSLIWVTIALITPLAALGLQTAFIRFMAVENNAEKIREGFLSIVLAVLAAGVSFSLILILCSDVFASSILGDANSSHLVKLASFMILTQALGQVAIAFFSTFRRMKWYSGLLAAKAAAELGLMFCFLLFGWELKGLIVAVLISDILCIATALSIVLRQIGFRFPKFAELRGYLKYGLPLAPNATMMWIIHSSDRYIIGYFMEAKDVGIYAAACGLTAVVSFILNPIGIVLFPTVSKSYDDGDIPKTKTYLKYSLKYLMLLSIPTAFGLCALASPLLRILTTPEFTPGSVVFPLLGLGLLFYGLYQVCVYIINLAKKTHLVVRLLSISAALNIGLNLLLIPHLGILGAAVATLIAYGVLGLLTLVVSSRYLKFDLGVPFLMKSVLASAIMALAIWLVNPLGLTEVMVSIVLGIVIYGATILALRGFSKNEVGLLKELLSGLTNGKVTGK